MFYEYDDNNVDDNDDIGDNKNDVNYIFYFPCLITQFTCYVLFLFFPCLYLIFLTDKPPILQIYNQCQIYPRSITQPCLSIYSSNPKIGHNMAFYLHTYIDIYTILLILLFYPAIVMTFLPQIICF